VESAMVTLARFRDCCPEMATEAAVCWRGRLSEELEAAGVAVHELGGVRARNPLSIWRARRRLHDLLCRDHFDAVVCHMPWTLAVFGPVVGSRRMTLVFRAHGASNPRHWVERWARMTRPDLILAVSRFVAGDVEKLYPGVPVEVVYNPVPPAVPLTQEERRAVRAELSTPTDAIVIVQAGRMQPGKGHGVLLDALAQLPDIPNWECWQIGGPQTPSEVRYFSNLQQQAFRLGIADRVRFLGQRNDVPRLLAAADIYCQPNDSFPEGMGLTFIEAMLAGRPVLTTAIGAAPEVLGESGTGLPAPGDSSGLAGEREKLVLDPAYRAMLAAKAKIGGRRFSAAVQLPCLYQVLRKSESCIQPIRPKSSEGSNAPRTRGTHGVTA
jgi:glycosyltransferase involved in cell wall biosynthesis